MPMGIGYNDDFEAEHDMRTLEEAEEIRNDNERSKRARQAAQDRIERLHSVAEEKSPDLEKGYTSLGRMKVGRG